MDIHEQNFLGLPKQFSERTNSPFIVLPIPYELTTTYLQGTSHGPGAIIKASQQVELYDEELDVEAYRKGIHTAPALKLKRSPERAMEAICQEISTILSEGKFPIALGGEHTLSVGAIRAFADRYHDLSILQLDAHADLRDEYEGSKFNHACTMRRILEHAPAVQVGIRSLSLEEADYIREMNLRLFSSRRIQDSRPWDEITSALSDHVYVTIDLDVFDPAVMPSVGTPEPGGLGWYDVLDLLRTVARETTIVGFDVVELCPQPGNIAPDFFAARLIYKIIGSIAISRGRQREQVTS